METGFPPSPLAPALLGAGALAVGAALWFWSSGEGVLRVGAGGVGVERGKQVTRVPWHAVERIVWDPDRQALTLVGKDELGSNQRMTLSPKVHPAAIAEIVKEGRARIPASVDVPDEAHGLPAVQKGAGELLVMDAVQVVGKRCAATDRVIAYEPDARVCPRCERVYHKTAVPNECVCGADLRALKSAEG
jgi:hypothetical protein